MSISFAPIRRSSLFALSGAGYALAFLTTASALTAQPAPATVRVRSTPSPPEISVTAAIRRDPFAPTPGPSLPATETTRERLGDVGFAPIPPGLRVPSIDGLDDASQAPGRDATRTLTLKATIAGPQPVAYVDESGRMEIVRPGDVIAGLRVAAIDLRGIAFDDGTRLALPERADRATPPQAAPMRAAARAGASAPPPLAAPSAAPSAVAAEPTAGPLPTPDRAGYAAGARPTSDPAAPTAFPYPFPYPPR